MGKDAPQAPAPPDYAGAAVAQGAANVDAARVGGKMSNPNIYGPLGSQTVTWNGDQPTINQSLTPVAQNTLEAQQRVQGDLANLGEQGIGTARNALNSPFSYNGPNIQTGVNTSGYPGLMGGIDTSGVAKMPVNAGMTGQDAIMARLQPQIERQQASTRQVLANQGIPQGSEAWQNAMTDQSQQQNDLLSQAALQGINLDMSANNQGFNQASQQAQFGNSANNQGYNQALQSGQFGNTAAGLALQQQLALRNQPLNEITGLMSGSQIQMPQFQGFQGQNVAPAPIFGAAQAQGQSAMDQYGIASGNVNANNAGLYGLAGAGLKGAMMFSDRRLKSDILRIGTHPKGFGIFEYTIFGRRERGVIAQEVRNILPHAVFVHPNGFLMVNYGVLDG